MSDSGLYNVILAPHVSEKSTMMADQSGQVVFRVAIDATKPQIRRAVEKLFSVEVESVQVVRQKGKQKTFGRVSGRRKDWKKAYIRLKQGQDIDFVADAG
jgi:large subunit ribosomal protein L23